MADVQSSNPPSDKRLRASVVPTIKKGHCGSNSCIFVVVSYMTRTTAHLHNLRNDLDQGTEHVDMKVNGRSAELSCVSEAIRSYRKLISICLTHSENVVFEVIPDVDLNLACGPTLNWNRVVLLPSDRDHALLFCFRCICFCATWNSATCNLGASYAVLATEYLIKPRLRTI